MELLRLVWALVEQGPVQHFLRAIGESPAAFTLEEIQNETNCDKILSSVIQDMNLQKSPKGLFQYQVFSEELGFINRRIQLSYHPN